MKSCQGIVISLYKSTLLQISAEPREAPPVKASTGGTPSHDFYGLNVIVPNVPA